MVSPTSADPDSPAGLGAAAAPPLDATSDRGPLSRRRILETAVVMIDEHDLRFLTMRRLGSALGVEAMALYHYVHSREDLLDGIVELVVDDLYGDPDVHLSGTHWQDYLQRLAHGVRRIALAHPQVFPLVATRPPAAPLGPAAVAKSALDGIVPRHPAPVPLHGRLRGRGLPGILELPARPSVAGGLGTGAGHQSDRAGRS